MTDRDPLEQLIGIVGMRTYVVGVRLKGEAQHRDPEGASESG
jgi:hypothetical protein